MNVRSLALDLLGTWQANESYINLSIKRATETLERKDASFLTALVFGTVEHLITLDYLISKNAKRSDFDPFTKDLLRLAFYELHYMKTAPYASVNEWTNLGRNKGEKSFVNGVLRGSLRNENALELPPKEKNLARYLSIAYSIPLPTIRILQTILGESLESFLKETNTPSKTTLRINTLKISREEYGKLLHPPGITYEFTHYSPFGIVISSSTPVPTLPGFADGLFFVQDEASQIETCILDPKPGEAILDVCACPGGKSFGCGIEMQNKGQILSCDVHSSKLSLVDTGANRLGIAIVKTKEQDATVFVAEYESKFDRVICDVPCSGLGVISKKPDLRYKDLSNLDDLINLQKQILHVSSQYVKVGGTLLYSTCTINPNENEAVVSDFKEKHSNFEIIPFNLNDIHSCGLQTLYPHIHHTDGFFLAKLQRRF